MGLFNATDFGLISQIENGRDRIDFLDSLHKKYCYYTEKKYGSAAHKRKRFSQAKRSLHKRKNSDFWANGSFGTEFLSFR